MVQTDKFSFCKQSNFLPFSLKIAEKVFFNQKDAKV